MGALDGSGGVVRLADGDHTVTKMRTRRLAVLEERYGGINEINQAALGKTDAEGNVSMGKLTPITAALIWAADLTENEDDAYDLLDGVPTMKVFQSLMVELVRNYAGDDAARNTQQAMDEAEAEQAKTNGKAPDPTNGARPLPSMTAPSPSPG